MRRSTLLYYASSVSIGVLCGIAATQAQGVMERERPEYDPIGVPAGAFRIFPAVHLALNYDDNVYRTERNEQSDTIIEFAPEVMIRSDWTRHMLTLRGAVQHLEHSDETSETRTNWDVGAEARIDIVRGSDLFLELSHTSTHEPRTSPELVGFAAAPTRYSVTHLLARFTYQPTRFGIQAGVSYDRYTFGDTPLIGGLPPLNNDDRDREQTELYLRADYEFSPGYETFVRATFDTRSYDLEFDRSGVDRSSDGYRLDAGLALLLTNLIRGEVYVGYLEQDYTAPLGDVSGFNYGAAIEWYATPLMTVHLNAARTLVDTTIVGASVRDDARFGVSLDYEVLRNVLLRGGVAYVDSEYPGSGRRDDYFDGQLGLTYLMNRYAQMTAAYAYSDRDSSLLNEDFSANLFSLRLRLQL